MLHKYKVTSRSYNYDRGRFLYIVENEEGYRFELTASQLASDKEFLKKLSFIEIFDVSYTAGMESILLERKMFPGDFK